MQGFHFIYANFLILFFYFIFEMKNCQLSLIYSIYLNYYSPLIVRNVIMTQYFNQVSSGHFRCPLFWMIWDINYCAILSLWCRFFLLNQVILFYYLIQGLNSWPLGDRNTQPMPISTTSLSKMISVVCFLEPLNPILYRFNILVIMTSSYLPRLLFLLVT